MNTDFGVISLDPQQVWKLKTIICLVKNTQLSFQITYISMIYVEKEFKETIEIKFSVHMHLSMQIINN